MNAPYNKPPNGDTNQAVSMWYDVYFSISPQLPPARPFETDIYIVSYKNPDLISYQIRMLSRFFRSPHAIIIVDNNCGEHGDATLQVREICERENVQYLEAPDNWYQHHFDGTQKLGTTLSFLFHNVIKYRKPKWFGFLDHDCFLFKKTTIDDLCWKNKMYGRLSMASKNIGTPWCLHVVANFFEFESVKHLPLDFRASGAYKLDTGGANFRMLFADKNMEDYRLTEELIPYPEGVADEGRQTFYEIIDSRWFHIGNSTHDQKAGVGERKLVYAKGFLDAVLRVSK